MQFTKEQLIEQAKDNLLGLKNYVTVYPERAESEAMNIRLIEIALEALTAEPVAWTDEQELRDVEKDGCGYLFKANPISPNADSKRVIKLYRHAQPASVVPEGLRMALSNAGIAAPESDEMLAATHEKYIQMLITWVKDRKPFQPAPVVPDINELEALLVWILALPIPTYKATHFSQKLGKVIEDCRSAMLQGNVQ